MSAVGAVGAAISINVVDVDVTSTLNATSLSGQSLTQSSTSGGSIGALTVGGTGAGTFAAGGSVEFWRSHLLRVLYAQHRPFLQAFVDFQFPGPDRDKPKLTIPEIRQLAKDLAKACANVSVELLDTNQSRAFIERVWTRTSSARAWVKG